MKKSDAGKTDRPRPFTSYKTYLDNFDKINWNESIEQASFDDTPEIKPIDLDMPKDPMLNTDTGNEYYGQETGDK